MGASEVFDAIIDIWNTNAYARICVITFVIYLAGYFQFSYVYAVIFWSSMDNITLQIGQTKRRKFRNKICALAQ